MDIKSLVRNVIPFTATAQAAAAKRRSQTENAADRDADGRQQQGEGDEKPPAHLSDSEIAEIIAYLEGLPGVKDNNLVARLRDQDGIKVIFVEDSLGKVVRRIPEAEFHVLLKSKRAAQPKSSGNLLNKTA